MNFSRYEIGLVHENKSYNCILYDADLFEGEGIIFELNGRRYAVAENAELPKFVGKIFESLRGQTFQSSQKLLETLDKSFSKVGCQALSLQEKIYTLGNCILLKNSGLKSDGAQQMMDFAYFKLKTCNSEDKQAISKIIQNSKCSAWALFEVANKIEKEGNVALAESIREVSRPFDLKKTVKIVCNLVSENYLNEMDGKKYAEHIASNLEKGEYTQLHDPYDFANRLMDDLIKISHDPHFEVDVKQESPPNKESIKQQQEKEVLRLEENHFGFGKTGEITILKEENACLLEIHKMENPKILFDGKELTKEKALSLISQIKELHSDAIIFDLRNNTGGSTYMPALFLNYFNPGDTERELSRPEYRIPIEGSDLDVFPTEPNKILSYKDLAEEKRILDTPIYILTSKDTFSAGEDFVCHFKELNQDNNRVKIVGETTHGGSHFNKRFEAGEHFNISIPFGGITVGYENYKKDWEGVGITPHIEVKADEALEHVKKLIKEKK